MNRHSTISVRGIVSVAATCVLVSCASVQKTENDFMSSVYNANHKSAIDDAAVSEQKAKEQIVEVWLDTVREAHYMHVVTDSVRTSYTIEENDGAQGKKVFDIRKLHAEAYMSRNSLHLLVWELDDQDKYETDHPAAVVSYSNGIAKERILNKDTGDYSSRTWPSSDEESTSRGTYEYGCDIGTMFVQWPGVSVMSDDWMEWLFSESVLLKGKFILDGKYCQKLKVVRDTLYGEESSDYKYEREEEFYFDEDNMLARWNILVTNSLSEPLNIFQ